MKVAEKQNTDKILSFIEESMYSFYETYFDIELFSKRECDCQEIGEKCRFWISNI